MSLLLIFISENGICNQIVNQKKADEAICFIGFFFALSSNKRAKKEPYKKLHGSELISW